MSGKGQNQNRQYNSQKAKVNPTLSEKEYKLMAAMNSATNVIHLRPGQKGQPAS